MKLKLHNSKITTAFFIVLSLFFVGSVFGQTAGDYRSKNTATANWSTLTTWDRYDGFTWNTPTIAEGYPGQNSGTGLVTITNHPTGTVTLNVSPANSISSLGIGETDGVALARLTYGGTQTLTVTGNATIYSALDVTHAKNLTVNAGVLNINGNLRVGTGLQGGSLANRVSILTITTGSVSVDGNLTLETRIGGLGNATQAAINITGATGTFNLKGSFTTPNARGTLNMSGTNSVFNYNGTSAGQTILVGSSSVIYNNLKINNTHSSGATFGAAVSATNVTGNIFVGDSNPGSLLNTNNLAVARGASDAITVAAASTLNAGTTSIAWGAASGTITVNGVFQTANALGFSGAAGTAISSTNSPAITLGANSTVNYNAAGNQDVTAITYANLILSNSGNKTIYTATTINANLEISGTAKGLLNDGGTSTTFTLSLGGVNQILGSWGSTGSAATNTNNTWFVAANTGIINVLSCTPSTAPTGATGVTTICVGGSTTLTVAGGSAGTGATAEWFTVSCGGTIAGTGNSIIVSPTATETYYVRYNGLCNTTSCGTVTVTVNAVPASGTLTPTPAAGVVCSGTSVSAMASAGSGGAGTIVDELEVSLSGGGFTAYVSNTPINTTGETSIDIRTRRTATGSGCTTSSYTTVTWTLESTTWTGTWSNGTPTSTKAVIFASNYTIGADMSACSITVNSGAVVSVTSGFDVTLNGPITVSSGSFTLNNNANLIQTTEATNSGNIIVKRNTNPLIRFDYTLWSSPVAGQQLLAFSPLTSISPTIRFYTYNTTTNLYNSVPTPGATNFAVGNGYLIRLPFNHPTAPVVWAGSFTGVPNNGTQTIGLTNIGVGQRFNAIGNPYPSTVDLADFALDNSTKIESTLYYWRKTNNTASPSYCTWNTTSNTFGDNGEAYTDSPLGILQTGQGFIVEAKAGATTVEFNNLQRVGDNANQFFRTTNPVVSTNPNEAHRIWLNLRGTGTEFSQTVVGYFTNATQERDDYDSKYYNDGVVALTSLIDSNQYAIQGRAVPFQDTDTVSLNFKAATDGQYTIDIDHVDGLFAEGGQAIYLKDNESSISGTSIISDPVYTNLNDRAYTFTSKSGTFSKRFELVYVTPSNRTVQNFKENEVLVYKQNEELVLNSNNTLMKSVKVFDVKGRLLVEKTAINASETRLSVGATNQVLLVQITSTDNEVVTKKVVN